MFRLGESDYTLIKQQQQAGQDQTEASTETEAGRDTEAGDRRKRKKKTKGRGGEKRSKLTGNLITQR